MEYFEIKVPAEYRYLSQWHNLLNILPQSGKYILNKVNTGCGGTTLFLESDKPCILVSPRSNVLYSKSAQYRDSHLFRTSKDTSTSPIDLKSRLNDYIISCSNPWRRIVPKILVTIDSYKYVAEQLNYMGILGEFIVLVDEFQCLMSDSKFKGKVEIEFLHNLGNVKSVCYMSATPIREYYLEEMPDFADVSHYFKLVWEPSALEQPNMEMRPYKAKQSSKIICNGIIAGYRDKGYFAQKIIDGRVVSSNEVVIFLNDVRTIVQIIKANKLPADEVNVLCSSSNKYVSELRGLGVHIGELATDPNNPKNRTFTFCTRASFEGVDFYSNSAFTYIFCDGILDWNRNDLIIDVPQILGRQRLGSNPFWKDAVLYYRPDCRNNSNNTLERIRLKEENTARWKATYDSTADSETKKMLLDGIRKRADDKRYQDDYVEVVDDVINGGFVVKENSLVKCTEIRDYEMSAFVYNSPLAILKTVVEQTDINVYGSLGYNTLGEDPVLNQFIHDFFKSTTFSEKMKYYSEMRTNHPEYDDVLFQNPGIEIQFHQYYETLGADRISNLRYREKDIEEASLKIRLTNQITDGCKAAFMCGGLYRLPDVKLTLQKIYKTLGVNATAKACDIRQYLPNVEERQLTNPTTGKRELYYEMK